jgi:hypothetical protein
MSVCAIPRARFQVGLQTRKALCEAIRCREREVRYVAADFNVEIHLGAPPVRAEQTVDAVARQPDRERPNRRELVFDRLDDCGELSRWIERGEVVLSQPEWSPAPCVSVEDNDPLPCNPATRRPARRPFQ